VTEVVVLQQAAAKAVWLSLVLAAPPVIVALVVGLAVSIVQTATQIQEPTLAFGPKVAAVAVGLALLARWYAHTLMSFGRWCLEHVAHLG